MIGRIAAHHANDFPALDCRPRSPTSPPLSPPFVDRSYADNRYGPSPTSSETHRMIARTLPRLAAFALLALSCYPCLAAVPVVTRLEPLGVRSGQETTITLHGARLKDAFDVLSEREGIEILEVKPENNAKVTVRLKVAEGAKNGFYPLVVATKTGLSNLRLLAVGSMPIINELEPNSDFASPQKIENNVTVEGVIQAEDQDFFAVDLKKGQRLTVEIAGVRIASTPRNNFVDPFIAILDAKR
ncbi:MAG: hypothetical protein AAFN70_03470, partial [Planctomycetota bacterium]